MIRNNNQNGRRRGRGGARPPQQGGGPSGNYGTTSGGGSRIDTRQRGNATQLLEKYKTMARDATQNGDRVQAEFYMQYADHYFRVLNEFRARDPQPAQRPNYDDEDDTYGGPSTGQPYAAASERDDDDDDRSGSDRSGGNGSDRGNGNDRSSASGNPNADRGGSERPAYRANGTNGDRSRNDSYAGQGERAPYAGQGERGAYAGQNDRPNYAAQNDRQRDDRDAARQLSYTVRDSADAPREDARRDERPDTARRDGAVVDGARRDGGRADGRGDYARETPQRDEPREPRAFVRRDNGRAAANELPRDAEPEMIGLPGPATIVATAMVAPPEVAASAPPMADGDAAPAPRKRGRPRKVVVTDDVDG